MNEEDPLSTSRLRRLAVVAVACVGVGAVSGLGVGTALGLFVPGYYFGVFGGGPSFDPVAVGAGLGLTQGLLGGLAFAGLIVWRSWPEKDGERGARRISAMLLWIAVVILAGSVWLERYGAEANGEGLRIAVEDRRVRLWNFGTRDKIVTHLICGHAQASLPKSILLRSHWNEASVELDKLQWEDSEGKSQPPPEGVDIVEAIVMSVGRQVR